MNKYKRGEMELRPGHLQYICLSKGRDTKSGIDEKK